MQRSVEYAAAYRLKGVLSWPESQLEPPSAAQRRVRCSLPPQGVLSWPESQLEPPSAVQRRVRCSLPP